MSNNPCNTVYYYTPKTTKTKSSLQSSSFNRDYHKTVFLPGLAVPMSSGISDRGKWKSPTTTTTTTKQKNANKSTASRTTTESKLVEIRLCCSSYQDVFWGNDPELRVGVSSERESGVCKWKGNSEEHSYGAEWRNSPLLWVTAG